MTMCGLSQECTVDLILENESMQYIILNRKKEPHGHSNRGSLLFPSKSIEHNPVSVSNKYYWQTGIERISTMFYRASAKTLQLTSKPAFPPRSGGTGPGHVLSPLWFLYWEF